MNIKYFKNGNINIKLDRDEIETINENIKRWNTAAELATLDILFNSCELDFIPAVDIYGSAGNFHAEFFMYNAKTGREYNPLDIDLINAASGATLKLYGRKITDEELTQNYDI